eukprot:1832551-Amphidinium_carterae.1
MRVVKEDDSLVKDLYDQLERQGTFAQKGQKGALAITNGDVGVAAGAARQTALNKLDQMLDYTTPTLEENSIHPRAKHFG